MSEMRSTAVINKRVKLIAVSGKESKGAAQLLTRILRDCGYRASQLSLDEPACEEAINTAGDVCDFVVLDTEFLNIKLSDKFSLETALIVGNVESVDEKNFQRFKNAVLPYSLNGSVNKENGNIIFYSIDDNEADLIAKNINLQEDRTVFELLGTGVIGRARFSKASGFSVELVLAVSSALIAMGVPLASVLGVINQL